MEDTQVQEEIERNQRTLDAMEAAGVSTTEFTQEDYFGFEEHHTVYLPDGKSYVVHQTLNEGARRKYMNSQNREVKLQKVTGDAILKMATGEERLALLKSAITGWNLVRKNPKTGAIEPVPFTDQNLTQFLDKANPKVVDLIDADVRKHNPWLTADITVEDIDKQIEELQKLKEDKIREDEAKKS